MKKKLPFEEAIEGKLNEVPLPAQEASWQAMEELLDKKKKRRRAFYFRRFVIAGVLLLGAAGGAWFFVGKEENKKTAVQENINTTKENNESVTEEKKIVEANRNTIAATKEKNIEIEKSVAQNDVKNNTGKQALAVATDKTNTTATYQSPVFKRRSKGKITTKAIPASVGDADIAIAKTPNTISKRNDDTINDDGSQNTIIGNEVKQTPSIGNSILNDNTNNTVQYKDSDGTFVADKKDSGSSVVKNITALLLSDTNSIAKQTTIAIAKKAKEKTAAKKYAWSAGLGLQQQIPIAGQEVSPYGYNGNKNFIDNYIPSVYVRFQKKNKWFVRAEFSYGAPHSVAPFAYNRVTKVNAGSSEISIATLSLKKTYYHELPVSFNYYIKKHWSIGAGVTYGLLHRAVSEKNIDTKDLQTGDETTTTQIIPSGYTDSFLYKSQWQWFLQTEYEWKRFSVGLRYSTDALPYIKYTLPTGELYQRRNHLLGFFIRARLF